MCLDYEPHGAHCSSMLMGMMWQLYFLHSHFSSSELTHHSYIVVVSGVVDVDYETYNNVLSRYAPSRLPLCDV